MIDNNFVETNLESNCEMNFFFKTPSRRYRELKTQDASAVIPVPNGCAKGEDVKKKGKRITHDLLNLGYNQSVINLLASFGTLIDGGTRIDVETVIFSDFVMKVNTWSRLQERTLMITTKAVYNLLPRDYSKCQRRIPLEMISGVTASQVSDEFVLHIPLSMIIV